MPEKTVCLAISGASGFQYAVRLLQCLLEQNATVHLVISDAAKEVARLECGYEIPLLAHAQPAFFRALIDCQKGILHAYEQKDWLSPIASGSARMDAMVVCPCSTGTLSAIANGASDNLIERGATVCLKEHRRLLIVPREMPVSAIQLEHMHKLACLGVRMLPASPGFYHKPQTINDLIDFVVARILQQLDMPQDLVPQWGVSGKEG
jgi:4-hydroxy-3-polyprenylbenzoate decarboxylase